MNGEVASLDVTSDRLTGIVMTDGTLVERSVLVVSTRLIAQAPFLSGLGLHPGEHPSGLGEYLKVDAAGATEVPGVWAAGNVTDPAAQVGEFVGRGSVGGPGSTRTSSRKTPKQRWKRWPP